MKKIFALILVLAMIATMNAVVFASEEAPENGDKQTTITYSVAPTYVVTIPTSITIDGEADTISAENVVVAKGQYVSVSLAEENDFVVTTAEGATLTYTVIQGAENIEAGDEILAVNPADGKTGSATITFDIDESAIVYAGVYTGTATFTIGVKDVANS